MADSIKFEKYDEHFFQKQINNSLKIKAADVISKLILSYFPDIRSVIDVGCGVGAWTQAFINQGINDFQAIDGDYINTDFLLFPKEHFLSMDLQNSIHLKRTFDLACSLEVAEHLPEERASGFIEDLTRLAPIILFSAAIPDQGGDNHINEQWQDYWAKLFAEFNYLPVDLIRPQVWSTEGVQTCYRQNTLVYIKEDMINNNPDIKEAYKNTNINMLPLVHPLTLKRLKKIWKSR